MADGASPENDTMARTGNKEGSSSQRSPEMRECEDKAPGQIGLSDIKQKSYSEAAATSGSKNQEPARLRKLPKDKRRPRSHSRSRTRAHSEDRTQRFKEPSGDEDGGDLALMGDYTMAEAEDGDLMTFEECEEGVHRRTKGPPVPPRTHSMGTEPEMGSFEHRLRHQPNMSDMRPSSQHGPGGDELEEPMDMNMRYSELDVLKERERQMKAEMESLRKRATSAEDKLEIEEGRSEVLRHQLDDMKRQMPALLSDVEKDTETLAEAYTRLQHDNRILKDQLRDAHSHIFSLQPYRKELTPEEVGREYDDLVEKVTDWVSKFMGPITMEMDEKVVEEFLTHAKKRAGDCARFKRTLYQYPDLLHGSNYPETDEDIAISIIMRFLHDKVFSRVTYGEVSDYVNVLSFIESHMQTSVEPKRDLFSIRSWVAEAYNTIFSSSPFQNIRHKAKKEMTRQLAEVFKVFCSGKEKWHPFLSNFESECVAPAMALAERLVVSTHHYYLDINPFIIWSQGGNTELESSPDFIDSVRDLDCRDLMKHRKAFNMSRIDPPPDKKALYQGLTNVCTVAPALYMRQIGRKDAIREPVLVRKQVVLVAWGDDSKKEKWIKNGGRTLVSEINRIKTDRLDSWVPSFTRWGG